MNLNQVALPATDTAMDERRETTQIGSAPAVANPGLLRPPVIYLCAIALSLLLHFAWPIPLLPSAAGVALGCSRVLAAVALFLSAARTFRRAGTPVPGNLPTTTIVRGGPFRWSRNPIYLAFSLVHLGVAFGANSAWLVITLVPAVALMALVVIPREERYLEACFRSDYLAYKAAVRRWL